jgi:predicted  nucleic acid-binding Zn-ribbon protein
VRCGKTYGADAIELIRGCSCGARIFLFMKREEDLKKLGGASWIERELKGIDERRAGKPISVEIENIRLLEKGVFELNLDSLIRNKDPIVVKDSYGVYYVKLPQAEKSSILKDDAQ